MWTFPERFSGRYVLLELLSLDHLPDFLSGFDLEVFRFLSRAPQGADEAALRAHLEALLQEPGRVNWALRPTSALPAPPSGLALAGRISILAPDPENRKLEIGTMLFKPFWGTPVNKEAKYLLLRHAFEVLEVERVQFKVDLRNERSQRALEALGAVREGVLRRNRRLADGTFRDDAIYSLLREEWPRVRLGLEGRLYGGLGAGDAGSP